MRMRENFLAGRACQFPLLLLEYRRVVRALWIFVLTQWSSRVFTSSFAESLVVIIQKIQQAFGDDVIGKTQIKELYNFKHVRTSVEDHRVTKKLLTKWE